jgi:alpha-amylase
MISNHSLINVEMSATSTKAYKIATAFALAHPYGIAKITTSYDHERFPDGPPLDGDGVPLAPHFDTPESCDNGYMCEHRWWSVANMVDFRYIVGYEPLRNWWDNKNDQVAFSRGHKGFIVLNKEGTDLEETLQTGLPEGTYCDIITGGLANGKCKGLKVEVNENGKALIFLPATSPDGVLAIHIESVLENV